MATQAGYSSMFIMINDRLLGYLLKGIIIASGNDACVVLQRKLVQNKFCRYDNEKAEIGMTIKFYKLRYK